MTTSKNIKRQTPVHVVAIELIGEQLRQVQHWLPLASRKNAKVEAVHQLRVATRRAMAAVVMFDEFLPPGHGRWYARELRRIRRAAGPARELDVMMDDLTPGGEIDDRTRRQRLKKLRIRRRAAIAPIGVVGDQLKGGQRLKKKWKITQSRMLGIPRPYQPYAEWAQARLLQETTRFFSAHPEDMDDSEQLHEFRIAGKALRYGLELLRPALSKKRYARVVPDMEKLQDYLGRINDHVTALQRMEKWAGDQATDRKTRRNEQKKLERSVRDFGKWWTKKRMVRLRLRLLSLANSA